MTLYGEGIAAGRGLLAERLAGLRAAGRLPAGARSVCDGLIGRFGQPVRIGLFGAPVAQSRTFAALAGQEVLPPALTAVSAEIVHGLAPELRLTLPDGTHLSHPGLPDETHGAERPVFMSLTLPWESLRDRKVLRVIAPPDPGEISRAMTWAEARVDLAIWCSLGWSDVERALWRLAPDRLRDHAILAQFGATGLTGPQAAEGFEAAVTVSDGSEGASALQAALARLVTNAEAEDRDAASALLRRFGAPGAAAEAAEAQGPADAALQTAAAAPDTEGSQCAPDSAGDARGAEGAEPAFASAERGAGPPPHLTVVDGGRPQPDPAPPAEAPDPAAREALARLFQRLRLDAARLVSEVPQGAPDEAATDRIFDGLDGMLAALSAGMQSDEALAETRPALLEAVSDATDLALLLRIEGGPAQVAEAAALVLQLRLEMEDALAA